MPVLDLSLEEEWAEGILICDLGNFMWLINLRVN